VRREPKLEDTDLLASATTQSAVPANSDEPNESAESENKLPVNNARTTGAAEPAVSETNNGNGRHDSVHAELQAAEKDQSSPS
jgi:hypothetical protein